MVNYHTCFPAVLPTPGRQISGYPPTSGSKTTLTQIPLCRFFFVTSSLSPHLARFIAHPVGCPYFRLRDSVGLAVGLAIKWLAALPSNAVEPSCRRSSYYRSRPSESDYRKSSYCRSTHRRSTYRGLSY